MIHNRTQATNAAEQAGNFFFATDSMRFFRSRIGKFYPVPGGAFFITSEQQDWNTERRYTIRFITDDGRTGTRYGYLNGFMRFGSRYQANRIAHRLQQIAKAVSA